LPITYPPQQQTGVTFIKKHSYWCKNHNTYQIVCKVCVLCDWRYW
jgi:hypothetical protein